MTKIMKKSPKVVSGPGRTEVRNSRADLNDARKLLGYKPTISLEEGLKKLL